MISDRGFRGNELLDHPGHEIDLLPRQARVGAEEKRLVHDTVRTWKVTGDPHGIGIIVTELDEGWLADKIATEKHAVADPVLVEMSDQLGAGEGRTLLDGDFESEPGAVRLAATIIPREPGGQRFGVTVLLCFGGTGWKPGGGVGRQGEFEYGLESVKTPAQLLPVPFPGLDESGQAADLDASDGGLDIEWLHVVAEVRIDVFVVVTFGEFAELPHEAFAAGVILAGRAPAIAAPVTERLGIGLERGAADDVDRSSLTHGQVVGRVEGLGGQVAEGARRCREVGCRRL